MTRLNKMMIPSTIKDTMADLLRRKRRQAREAAEKTTFGDRVRFEKADVQEIPYENDSFDVVVNAERFSPWLYLCMIFLALFLAIGKRRHELVLLEKGANSHRKILDQYNVKMLDDISDEDITGFNIPTGVPLAYELDADLKPVSSEFLGDPDAIAKAAAAVAAQGKAK